MSLATKVKRKVEDFLGLKSGNMPYFQGIGNGRCSSLRFFINKSLKNNIIKATRFSDKIAMLTVKLSNLNIAEIIQVNAASITCEDQVTQKFYEDVVKALRQTRNHKLRIIMEDLNERIGSRQSDQVVGVF